MGNKISLAGDLGSGKSTVAKLLIEALGAEYYSTGAIVRAVAEKRGMSVADLNVYMETHPEIDKEIDDGLALLSEDERPLVIDSRMAWHFTQGTFKVYLSTDAEVAALRIMNAGRTGESTASLEVQVSETKRRRESEKKRYSEKYGVDIQDLSNYDLVVEALEKAGRTDLIGFDNKCLIRPKKGEGAASGRTPGSSGLKAEKRDAVRVEADPAGGRYHLYLCYP